MSPPVPRAAEWILTHLVQADAADVIAGDLREEFHLVVEARGRGLARLWYWRQVVVAVRPLPPAPQTTSASQAEMLNAGRD